MDFIFDNIYIIAVAAAGLVQWWKSTQDAKKERENPYRPEEYQPQNYEELLEEAERRYSRPAVPPPLPPSGPPPQPSFERNPAPTLLKKLQASPPSRQNVLQAAQQASAVEAELARQAAIADQLRALKESKKRKTEAAEAAKRVAETAAFSGSVRDRLKNPVEIRNAFVLKEILDKPISLRSTTA
jgi:hypothetical protein